MFTYDAYVVLTCKNADDFVTFNPVIANFIV